ncbi:MAG: hypothetical protein AB3N64_04550 [Puniceicoccaceae bacterium]
MGLFLLPGASAVDLKFDRFTYVAARGDKVSLVTSFSGMIPSGLEGYALQLNFPAGTASLSTTDIEVPAPLDFGLFNPGAERSIGVDFASVAGFIEFGQTPYFGTAFVEFEITIPANAPLGFHAFSLVPLIAGGDNFVNGQLQVLDDSINFGSATIQIVDSRPVDSFEDLQITRVAGQNRLSFTGSPQWIYTIQASDNSLTDWQTLAEVYAASNGFVQYADTTVPVGVSRFYRIIAGRLE